MNVLMICTEMLPVPPIRGGAVQTYIEGILPMLKEKHQITVLGIQDPGLPDEETADGIHYVRIPGKRFPLYKEGVINFLQKRRFDLIHIFNRPRLVLPVREAAPQAEITLSMHNDMFQPEKLDPEEGRMVVQEVSKIVTISNYIGKVISELYPEAAGKVRTIYSGVDTNLFLPGDHPKMQKIRKSIRKEFGLENKKVILYAGRLSPNKGVDKLLLALPEIAKKHRDIALVIAGSNWYSENRVTDYVAYVRALAKTIKVPIITTGFVAPKEIPSWFAAADLFVCTSVWQEPLARVHYEAMAAGLPIITTNRGGNPEVIVHGKNGFVVSNPEDPEQFVQAIRDLLSNPSLMARMGSMNRKLAEESFQWYRVASDVLSVWDEAGRKDQRAMDAKAAPVTMTDLQLVETIEQMDARQPDPVPVTEPKHEREQTPEREPVEEAQQALDFQSALDPQSLWNTQSLWKIRRLRKKRKAKEVSQEKEREAAREHEETLDHVLNPFAELASIISGWEGMNRGTAADRPARGMLNGKGKLDEEDAKMEALRAATIEWAENPDFYFLNRWLEEKNKRMG